MTAKSLSRAAFPQTYALSWACSHVSAFAGVRATEQLSNGAKTGVSEAPICLCDGRTSAWHCFPSAVGPTGSPGTPPMWVARREGGGEPG